MATTHHCIVWITVLWRCMTVPRLETAVVMICDMVSLKNGFQVTFNGGRTTVLAGFLLQRTMAAIQ